MTTASPVSTYQVCHQYMKTENNSMNLDFHSQAFNLDQLSKQELYELAARQLPSLIDTNKMHFQNLEHQKSTAEKLREFESLQQMRNSSVSPPQGMDLDAQSFGDIYTERKFKPNSSPHQDYKTSPSSLSSYNDNKFSRSVTSTTDPSLRSLSSSSFSDNSLPRPPSLSSATFPNFDDDDDDDDDSWKICGVCNDKATGYHFNALTCEGCKGFFRRSMKNGKSFTCPYNGNCLITKSNRRQCQACRLQKCLRIGMKKECIMSQHQIEKKKNLVISNRIKKVVVEWRPQELSEKHHSLLRLLTESHVQCNNPPDEKIFQTDISGDQMECSSPASTCSTSSGFSDLINKMTEELAARQPGKFTDAAHVKHFSAIMEFSIKEIIRFCKKIPTFQSLNLTDQINLLKAGCTEILFIKANYTYDIKKRALTCGPDVVYTRTSFLQGGMSEEYTDLYLKFHHDMGLLQLDDTEMASLCALTLFSADRGELEKRDDIEGQQLDIATALQAYAEQKSNSRTRFPQIVAFLTRLRTLNVLIAQTINSVQKNYHEELPELVLEIANTGEEEEKANSSAS